MADIGKNEANKMANAVETRIKQIAQQVYKEVPNDKEVEGLVISKNSQNRYTLKINNAIYTNIMQERSLGEIALNTIVKVKIPNNQINNAYICGVVDGSIIKQGGGGGGSAVNVVDSLDSTSTTEALSANQGRILNNKIISNTNEITALKNNKANQSDLDSLKTVVDGHSTNISSLQTDVSNAQQAIGDNTTDINSLKETKADTNASNLSTEDIEIWKTKLNVSSSIKLYDTLGQNTDGALTQKFSTEKLNEKVEFDEIVDTPEGLLSNEILLTKAELDASNLSSENITSWLDKLGITGIVKSRDYIPNFNILPSIENNGVYSYASGSLNRPADLAGWGVLLMIGSGGYSHQIAYGNYISGGHWIAHRAYDPGGGTADSWSDWAYL